MFVSPDNWGDAEKYFQGCYIKVKEKGDTLFYIDKVTPEGLFGSDKYGESILIEYDGTTLGTQGYELDYIIPKKAYFQFGSNAFFLSRIPARMWKKGINKQNTKLQFLDSLGSFGNVSLGFDHLDGYVNKPGYVTYTNYKNYDSIALSPRFAMTSVGDIFLDLTKIGKYYPKEKTVITRKLFMESVKQLFPGVKIVKA